MRKSMAERYTLIWKKYLHKNVVAVFYPATIKCDLLFLFSFHEIERIIFIIIFLVIHIYAALLIYKKMPVVRSSVQFSHSATSDSVTPQTVARQASLCIMKSRSLLKCMSISQWCHLTISSLVIPFSFCLQSFPVSGSFLMSQFFTSGGQSTGVSASVSVLPMNIQDWFPLGLTCLISL